MKEALTRFLVLKQTKEDQGVDHPRLIDVFSAHYMELLDAIALRETAILRKKCEGNLYRALMEGLEDISEQEMKVKVMRPFDFGDIQQPITEETLSDYFKMEVIDFENVFGVSLDRETNNRVVYRPVSQRRPNLRTYVPTELEWNDTLAMTMRVVVKITTPIKLNLIQEKADGQAMIPEED